MTPDEARAALVEANQVLATCALLMGPIMPTLERYATERERMESVGLILDPTLYMSLERRRTDDVLAPVYTAAARFYAAHAEALAKLGEGK